MNTSCVSKDATICDNSGGILQVRVERPYGCGNCAKSLGCGLSVLPGGSAMRVRLPLADRAEFEVGQTIRLSLPTAELGRLAALHYLTVPVSMFVGALLLSYGFAGGGDLAAMLGGAIGFFLGCAVLKLYDSRAGQYWLGQLEMRHLPDQLTGGSGN